MTQEILEVYRHSLAHILAKAVIEIFGKENVQYAIGPQIADGMYYDFILPRSITEDDYKMIEDNRKKPDIVRQTVSYFTMFVTSVYSLMSILTYDIVFINI